MSKQTLNQEEIQSLEISQLEEVSGGIGGLEDLRGGGLVNGIPMPEEAPTMGEIKSGGGFPFGIVVQPGAERSFEF